jgi:uncharacterized NAD-dependent epimerase/dehydratase family protein
MILVHPPGHEFIDDYPLRIPPLDVLVRIHEEAAGWVKPAPVVGIALNTRGLDEDATMRAIEDAARITGLPATDPVKFGGKALVEATLSALSSAVGR